MLCIDGTCEILGFDMIRAADSWYSRADDSNPFFEDEDRPDEYTSTCAKICFKFFRFLCLVVLYVMLGWSALFIIVSLYGFAHYASFADSIQSCVEDSGEAQNEAFRHHHSVRITLLMVYGLSATAFTLTATRAAKFSVVVKVCLLGLGLVMTLASLSGEIVEMIWPLEFNDDCSLDSYIVWLYRGWPFYTATLLLFAIFTAFKYFERKCFIMPRD